MDSVDRHTHFYLYAKGHYEKSIFMTDDLRHLVAEYTMTPVNLTTTEDVLNVLLDLTYKCIQKSGNPSSTFIHLIKNSYNYDKNFYSYSLIGNCLKIIRFTRVDDINIGVADPNILPLTEAGKWYSKGI